MQKKLYKRVLAIAGSDSGGGAGIQADIKAISANACYAMSVITALTAQNTQGVLGIHPIPVEFVRQQMDAVLDDIGADAVKIGMLFSPELVETVADGLAVHNVKNIVLDPVMVATSGGPLLTQDAVQILKEKLMPMALLVTPNLPEAEILSGQKIANDADMEKAARNLCDEYGCHNALIKGGHLQTQESSDLLWINGEKRGVRFQTERIITQNTHGTGCTLSSAIAARLACSLNIEQAVQEGKEYITMAIRSGAQYSMGKGHGPVNHFYQITASGRLGVGPSRLAHNEQ